MSKLLTIKKNKDFTRAYAKGSCKVSPVIVTYVRKNRQPYSRLGITTSKKIGKAVYRNRARRLIKNSFRTLLPKIKPGYDIVFVARGKTPFVKCDKVLCCMENHLRDAKILSDV